MARTKKPSSRSAKPASTSRKKRAAKTVSSAAKPSTVKVKAVKPRTVMPGVFSHTAATWKTLLDNRGLMLRLLVGFWVVLLLVVGISQQVQYQSARDSAELYSSEVAQGAAQKAFEVGVLFISFVTGGQNVGLSETQQVAAGFMYLLLWLVTIWLLRQRLAGSEVIVRDGLYSGTAPLVATLALGLLALLQLLPLALSLTVASIILGSTQSALVIVGTVTVLLLLLGATMYFLLTTLFAAIIATVPGTYPLAAYRSAKQLVKGLRAPLLLRVMWLVFISIVVFSLGVIVTVAIDRLLGSGSTLFVAAMVQLVGIAVGLYVVTYLYLLYRKVVDA